MNRKIFTLLAGALMLLSTAFVANAKIGFGSTLSGDVVKTLPDGEGRGLYHIRIDSILDTTASGQWQWVPVNYGAGGPTPAGSIFTIGFGNNPGFITPGTPSGPAYTNAGYDTVVLAVNQYGKLIPVSMYDFRYQTTYNLKYKDLQATMWCVETVTAPHDGFWPTFFFHNKASGGYLPFSGNSQYVQPTRPEGSMYSQSYYDGQLAEKQPLYRKKENKENDTYQVLAYRGGSGIQTVDVNSSKFTTTITGKPANDNNLIGLLKISIVEVGPVVLDADAFNTRLGEKDAGEGYTQLSFTPDANPSTAINYFGKPLQATDVPTTSLPDAIDDGKDNYLYLNVEGDPTQRITHNLKDSVYVNQNGRKYLKIAPRNPIGDTGVTPANSAYRFVYFPSTDSLIINAYQVKHSGNGIGGAPDGTYQATRTGGSGVITRPYLLGTTYHGLYSEVTFNRLIVRLQDLDGAGTNQRLITIDNYPGNAHISLNNQTCGELKDAAFLPKGVFTVWDDRGRVLGVRIYQGALVPQWLELEPGECPDRIPAYQWVIEPHRDKYVSFKNREFVNLTHNGMPGAMYDVFIAKEKKHQIFGGSSIKNFDYPALNGNGSNPGAFEPIEYGWVTGQYLDTVKIGCGEIENGGKGGFRPVPKQYVQDPYLGYKHFYVEKNKGDASYGKSEDKGREQGMDYNAFAFNYYSAFGDDAYIGLNTFTNDKEKTILQVSNKKKDAFQFMLGTELRTNANPYTEEPYGTDEGEYTISTGRETFKQDVPRLKRYYYELKIADYYHYRDSLNEQFVVLKGAADDGSDAANALRYGVANAYADKHPFKMANVYLRESYFIDGAKPDEYQKYPGVTTYYAILDRIEERQFQRLADMGHEVTAIIGGLDPFDLSRKFGIVTWGVEDAAGYVKAQGRTVSSVRVSTFALEHVDYELYRRLNHQKHDGANSTGDFDLFDRDNNPNPYMKGEKNLGESVNKDPLVNTNYDAPKVLRFQTHYNTANYLHEDALSGESFNKGGINFLGLSNSHQYPEGIKAPDGTIKYNYNLFVDTAYINRGTGPIKPQYLIAVDPEIVPGGTITGKDDCDSTYTIPIKPYIRARYLINATDSARQPGSTGKDGSLKRDENYITQLGKDRLAFVDAIHIDDRLYIVGKLREYGIPETAYQIKADDGKLYIDADKLATLTAHYERLPLQSGGAAIGAFYDFGRWENYHNDVSFSLRFVDSTAKNADPQTGDGGTDNASKRFLLESETTNRTPYGNRKIAPVQGGWVQISNGAAVLSRGAYYDAIEQAEVFNVEIGDNTPTSNDKVSSSAVEVITGTGEISILNAGGKKITVANILGQTIADFVAGSDKATLTAPKGIVLVTVEGEKTVKAIVK